MNPFDSSLFTAPSCLPCCTPAPADCPCALLIPPFASPYADYATAETAIADQTDNCIGYCVQDGDTGNVLSFAFDGTTITGSADTASSSSALELSSYCYFSVSLKSGATVTVPWSISTDGAETAVNASILDCATGDFVAGEDILPDAGASGTLSFVVPADGEYVLLISGLVISLGILTYVNFAFTVTCDMDYWVNPVIALWDDSGTTRRLWACPKLLLPPLTESTGDWYADCASAAAVMADTDQVSNCVGYTAVGPGAPTFTATDGGSSLTLATVHGSAVSVSRTCWGGVNAVGGQTITVTASVGSGTPGIVVNIYDDTGTLVEGSGSVSSPWVSAALPYTGRYTISVIVDTSSTTTTFSAVITSSGTLTVNPIQALYDIGLDCPAHLNCGDSCP